MSRLKDLFHRGWKRLTGRGRPEPTDDRDEHEAQMKELLEEYADQMQAGEESPTARGPWIFQRQIEHELFLQTAMSIVDEARMAGRREGAAAVDEFGGDDCACRCRDHGRVGCPTCLNVNPCPVHGDDNPARISPRWREEHP